MGDFPPGTSLIPSRYSWVTLDPSFEYLVDVYLFNIIFVSIIYGV